MFLIKRKIANFVEPTMSSTVDEIIVKVMFQALVVAIWTVLAVATLTSRCQPGCSRMESNLINTFRLFSVFVIIFITILKIILLFLQIYLQICCCFWFLTVIYFLNAPPYPEWVLFQIKKSFINSVRLRNIHDLFYFSFSFCVYYYCCKLCVYFYFVVFVFEFSL